MNLVLPWYPFVRPLCKTLGRVNHKFMNRGRLTRFSFRKLGRLFSPRRPPPLSRRKSTMDPKSPAAEPSEPKPKLLYDLNDYRPRTTAFVPIQLLKFGGEIPPVEQLVVKKTPTKDEEARMCEQVYKNASDIFKWCQKHVFMPSEEFELLHHPLALTEESWCCGVRSFRKPLLAVIFLVAYPVHVIILLILLPIVFAYNFNSTLTTLIGVATSIVNSVAFTNDPGLSVASNVLGIISGVFVVLAKYEIQSDAIFAPKYTAYKIYSPLVGRSYDGSVKVQVAPFWVNDRHIFPVMKQNQRAIRFTSDFICLIQVLVQRGYYVNPVTADHLVAIVNQLADEIHKVRLFEYVPQKSNTFIVINQYNKLIYSLRDEATFCDFCWQMTREVSSSSDILGKISNIDVPAFFQVTSPLDEDLRKSLAEMRALMKTVNDYMHIFGERMKPTKEDIMRAMIRVENEKGHKATADAALETALVSFEEAKKGKAEAEVKLDEAKSNPYLLVHLVEPVDPDVPPSETIGETMQLQKHDATSRYQASLEAFNYAVTKLRDAKDVAERSAVALNECEAELKMHVRFKELVGDLLARKQAVVIAASHAMEGIEKEIDRRERILARQEEDAYLKSGSRCDPRRILWKSFCASNAKDDVSSESVIDDTALERLVSNVHKLAAEASEVELNLTLVEDLIMDTDTISAIEKVNIINNMHPENAQPSISIAALTHG